MSIPPYSNSGVLPPYLGDGPGDNAALMSPYEATSLEVIERFATSPERINILAGWLNLRAAFRTYGITSGFQWLDGSFVEAIDAVRPPRDIDVVTFSSMAVQGIDQQRAIAERPDIFDHDQVKQSFSCDSFLVDLDSEPWLLVWVTRYWFGLFSHRREIEQWKGMVQVALEDDGSDEAARVLLEERTLQVTQ